MTIRLDRAGTLYVASPLRKLTGTRGAIIPILPILMYHGIGDEQFRGHPYYRTTISPRTFFAHMEHLARNGYQPCTPSQAVSLLKLPSRAAQKRVVITFDDGFLDFYTDALPVLSHFGFSAIVYLPTGYIGGSVKFKGRTCLTWSQVRELQQHGMSIGSHTVTHPQLHTLSPAEIQRELVDSKCAIEDRIGAPVRSFAYPYAFPQIDREFRRMLIGQLKSAGYRDGVCTIVGRADGKSDPFLMERLPVNDADDEALLAAKLSGAYDWVGCSQYAVKWTRSVLSRFPFRSNPAQSG